MITGLEEELSLQMLIWFEDLGRCRMFNKHTHLDKILGLPECEVTFVLCFSDNKLLGENMNCIIWP